MDVESLAKELILKNMTPEQQMAVLDSVRQSVVQAKEVQKRKIGENVDLVVQALKKIESDIRSRFDDVGNAIEKRVSTIKDGRDGIDGKDGRDGKDGKNGRDGAKGEKGESGQDGIDGVDGVDGVSVTNAHIDFDGSLIITLSTGVEINVGEVVAPDLAERIKVITNGGGTSQSVLDTLASLQTQITNLIPSQTGNSGKYLTTNGTALSWASIAGGGLSYQGTWNASTNTPTLVSSTGVNGYYYITATAGSTNLDGITDWQIGDWLLFNGTVWQKIDQSNLVTSVAGRTGAVTLANTDISGLGTMSTQNANSVAITGGTATLTSLTTATVQATNSAGLNLKNSAGTTQLSMGAGGGDNLSLNVSTNINGTNAQVDISPTGTGHVHIKPTGVNSIEIAPTYAGDMDNMIIGAVTPKGGTFTALTATGTTTLANGAILGTPASGNLANCTFPTLNQNTTGSAATLTTARAIYGNNFDGSAALTQVIASTYGGTGNGFTKFTGATTAEKTYTLPDATTTILTTNAAVTVGQGGTGQTSYTDGQLLIGNTTGNTLTKATLTAGSGISITNGNGSISIAASGGSGVTSVTGTAPVVSSGGTTPAISLASGYGDTLNPYASKTANYFLSAPNGSAGVPTFRAIVAADIPTLNQNTTGTAGSLSTASGSAPSYSARAWVSFNGTGTVAINASGNVTSITDNGVGDYTVNLTTAMSDANYSVALVANASYGVDRSCHPALFTNISAATESTPTTSAFKVGFSNAAGGAGQDLKYISVAVFR